MFKKILEAFRDMLFGILPGFFCRIPLNRGAEFAFLCHPLDARDAVRKYPFAKGISEKLFRLWVKSFWPILGCEIFGPKKSSGTIAKGWVVISPLSPAIMLEDPERARKMILRATRLCQKLGVRLVALGGYNSILTHDGKDLIGKTKLSVTTGNTYSVLLVLQNLFKVVEILAFALKSAKVGIVGAAGSVGTACAKLLAEKVKELSLMDLNRKELMQLVEGLRQTHENIKVFERVDEVKNFDVVITATSTPKAIIYSKDVRSGMIFIDASQPYNISEDIVRAREDILVINSGIAKAPVLECDIDLGPFKNEIYACTGEALVLTCEGIFSDYSIGKVDPKKVLEFEAIAKKHSFDVADFRNAAGYISQQQLDQFKKKFLRINSATKR